MRYPRLSVVLAVCLLAGSGFVLERPVAAQSAKAKSAASESKGANPQAAPKIPWIVNCASVTGQVNCEAVQRLMLQKTGQLLLGITIRLPKGAKDPTMMVQLPHGMYLPSGVSLKIDDSAAKKEPVQTCDAKGCYVGLAIDPGLLKTMQSGKAMTVTFQNLAKKDITIPVTLSGFAEAYKKLL